MKRSLSKMDEKSKKFKAFLESLKTDKNSILLEVMNRGFSACFESVLNEMPIENARRIASEWGDDGSALQIFAEMGSIMDHEHKVAVMEEILANLNALLSLSPEETQEGNYEMREEELLDLKDFIEGFVIPEETMMEAVVSPKKYMYKGQPIEVLRNNGMDEEGSTEIWTIKTPDGRTFNVFSRDIKQM